MKEIIIAYDENIEASPVMGDWVGELVRCKDCKYRPKQTEPPETYGFSIEFPEGSKCPCQCSGDGYYSWYPEDDWFCADGEREVSK